MVIVKLPQPITPQNDSLPAGRPHNVAITHDSKHEGADYTRTT